MMRKMVWIAAIAIVGFTLSGGVSAEEKAPAAGKKINPDLAPAFVLKDLAGKERSLKEFAGKFVVLEWCNHGCPFVKKHYQKGHMQKLQEKYTKKGVIWLTICSSAEAKQGWMTTDGWKAKNEKIRAKPTAVLIDVDGKIGKAYGAKTTPQICIINKKGVRVYDGAIDDNRSRNTEDIKTSKNYVSLVLDALMAGKPSPIRRTRPYGCSVKYASP